MRKIRKKEEGSFAKGHSIFILILLLVVVLGFTQIVRNYNITGQAITEAELNEGSSDLASPKVAALLRGIDHKLVEDNTDLILEKDDNGVTLIPSSNPAKENDKYLYISWPYKVDAISFYMKGENGNPYFELWGPNNILIMSGVLQDTYRWYTVDVSSEAMQADFYALYNYDWGGEGNILIDKVVAKPSSQPGLVKITGA